MANILTVPEVAKILRVNKKSIYEQIKQKNLKAVKIGRSLRISELELETFIEKGGGSWE